MVCRKQVAFVPPSLLRQVFTLNETVIKTTPVGQLLLYAGDSYQKTHNRSPADDGLTVQKLDLPGGIQANGVKARARFPLKGGRVLQVGR